MTIKQSINQKSRKIVIYSNHLAFWEFIRIKMEKEKVESPKSYVV